VLRESAQARFEAPGVLSDAARASRDGRNAVERKAVSRVRREIAAMPASLVVQLALWPDEIAAWARGETIPESLVYNMLARRKPYQRVRERLADRLEVPVLVLAHLIDARRPLPSSKRDLPLDSVSSAGAAPIDWGAPPYPLHRDGTNPIERRAVRAVERELASMPASAVVGLALWPGTLAEWSREQRLKASVVWATLAGSPSERVRSELARRLDVTLRDLDDLIAADRRAPSALRADDLPNDERSARAEDDEKGEHPSTPSSSLGAASSATDSASSGAAAAASVRPASSPTRAPRGPEGGQPRPQRPEEPPAADPRQLDLPL